MDITRDRVTRFESESLEREQIEAALSAVIFQREVLLEALVEIEASSTDQHAVGIAKAALAKVEE